MLKEQKKIAAVLPSVCVSCVVVSLYNMTTALFNQMSSAVVAVFQGQLAPPDWTPVDRVSASQIVVDVARLAYPQHIHTTASALVWRNS